METPRKNPYIELTEWLSGFPEQERDKLSAKALINLKREYWLELENEDSEVDGDERWEELLADPRSNILLDRMAEESKQARREGKLEPISALFEEYAHLLDKEK